jgi:hypothetical protein
VEGRIFTDPALPGVAPPERRALVAAALETLERLHALDPVAVGLGTFGRPSGYYERQVSTLARISEKQVGATYRPSCFALTACNHLAARRAQLSLTTWCVVFCAWKRVRAECARVGPCARVACICERVPCCRGTTWTPSRALGP